MSVIRSNLISIINKFIFSGIILLILRNPAAVVISELQDFNYYFGIEIWIFLALSGFGVGNFIINEAITEQRKQQLISIMLVILAALIPILLAWPAAFFLTFSLILYMLSLRGNMYESRVDFSTDLPWMLLIYLLSIVLAGRMGVVTALGEVVLFMLLVILLGIMLQLRKDKFESSLSAFKILLPFFTFLLIIALLLSVPFNIPIFSGIVALVNLMIDGVFVLIDLALVPISYLVIVFYYIIRWLQSIFGGEPEIIEELGGFEEAPEDQFELAETASESAAGNIAGIIIIVLLGFLAFWMLKKYLNYREGTEEDVREVRENLDAAELFKRDVKNLFNNLRSRFGSKSQKPEYNMEDPCEQVRYFYYSFLQKAARTTSRSPGVSPRQYCENLAQNKVWQQNYTSLGRLTKLYEKARYGQEITREEAEEAEMLWNKLSGIDPESHD